MDTKRYVIIGLKHPVNQSDRADLCGEFPDQKESGIGGKSLLWRFILTSPLLSNEKEFTLDIEGLSLVLF